FDSERTLETAVFTLCVSLIAVDAIGGLTGRGSGHVTIAMPLLMVGLTAAFLARNVQLFRSSAQINRMLNARLAEREAELTRAAEHGTPRRDRPRAHAAGRVGLPDRAATDHRFAQPDRRRPGARPGQFAWPTAAPARCVWRQSELAHRLAPESARLRARGHPA